MRIYTTSVISRGIYTPKVFFSFIWYALKNPGLGLGGRGVGSSCVLYAKKCVYVRENRVPNTRKNCFWRINATRNDIRAIDTNFHEIGLDHSLSVKSATNILLTYLGYLINHLLKTHPITIDSNTQ